MLIYETIRFDFELIERFIVNNGARWIFNSGNMSALGHSYANINLCGLVSNSIHNINIKIYFSIDTFSFDFNRSVKEIVNRDLASSCCFISHKPISLNISSMFIHTVVLFTYSSSLIWVSRYVFNMGCRVPLRGRVNEPIMTGLRVVDTILPIGRGQRQLIIGDRFTGKTSIYINTIINNNRNNFIKSVEGFGCKRLFGVYVAINQNLSRIYKITYIFNFLHMNWYNIIIATHTTSPAMLSYLAPYNGTAIAEYLRDNG